MIKQDPLRKKALALLARREHSRVELMQKLQLRGFDNIAIQNCLDELAKQNLQNDARFTEEYVFARKQAGFGPKRIALELEQRGISAAFIAKQVCEHSDEWRQYMRAIVEKKFSKKTSKADNEARIYFLLSRGYSLEMIHRWMGVTCLSS